MPTRTSPSRLIRRGTTVAILTAGILTPVGVIAATPTVSAAATTDPLGPTIADLQAEVARVVNDVELVPCLVTALINTLEGGGFLGC